MRNWIKIRLRAGCAGLALLLLFVCNKIGFSRDMSILTLKKLVLEMLVLMAYAQFQRRIQKGFRGIARAPSRPRFLNILSKWYNLVSLRPNYFILMGYLRNNEITSNIYTKEIPFQKSWIRPCIQLFKYAYTATSWASLFSIWIKSKNSNSTAYPFPSWIFKLNSTHYE